MGIMVVSAFAMVYMAFVGKHEAEKGESIGKMRRDAHAAYKKSKESSED